MRILVAFLMLFAFTFAEAKDKKSKKCEQGLNSFAAVFIYKVFIMEEEPTTVVREVKLAFIENGMEKECNMPVREALEEALNRAKKLSLGEVSYD